MSVEQFCRHNQIENVSCPACGQTPCNWWHQLWERSTTHRQRRECLAEQLRAADATQVSGSEPKNSGWSQITDHTTQWLQQFTWSTPSSNGEQQCLNYPFTPVHPVLCQYLVQIDCFLFGVHLFQLVFVISRRVRRRQREICDK